ncbi:MAG: hypothetical protein CL920_04380 [Deltaproteobacteria bacterium]|nr:hypothetical protein [Deltaproteobacteria bacterium]|tara:strand:+ start:101 stop:1642 length:1542 start_codon:yes stop_codon:yes gene_type:complete
MSKSTTVLVGLALVFLSGGCCPYGQVKALELPTPTDLPEKLHFRTRTQTFNQSTYFILRDGRIWYKPIEKKDATWKLLGKTGLPEGCDLKRFGPPEKLVSITADGIHLQALSAKGIFYRGDNIRDGIGGGFSWKDAWGWPASDGPGLTSPFGAGVIWDVADSHSTDLTYYEDGNGTRHHIGFGVAHLYMLGTKGKKIYFNDWWLPADFSRQACGPRRGTFKAINMSVSGSTIFLINEKGSMFTRMHDFDISGENPMLTYTFVNKKPPAHVRKLPMPPWRKQPALPTGAKITKKITIIQNGQGNAARELRVEGELNGQVGYFYKAIFADKWSFRKTDHKITDSFLNTVTENEQASYTNPEGKTFQGTLRREGVEGDVSFSFVNFHMVCSPATLRLMSGGKAVVVDGKELQFAFHHVHTLVTKRRKVEYWTQGVKAKVRAALVIPEDLMQRVEKITDPILKKRLKEFFEGVKVINFSGDMLPSQMKLTELTRGNLFRAHDDEKPANVRFRLTVGE